MAQPDVLVISQLHFEVGSMQAPYSGVSRLFRRHPELHWSRPYHSVMDDSVHALLLREPSWRIEDCPEPALLHDGHSPERLADSGKGKRLRQAMEAELRRSPGEPYASAKLAGLEMAEDYRQRALQLIRDGLAHCPEGQACERYELLLHGGMALVEEDSAGAAASYSEAMNLPLPRRVTLGARLNLAILLMRGRALPQAEQVAQEITELAPEVALAWYKLGLVRRQAGGLVGAVKT